MQLFKDGSKEDVAVKSAIKQGKRASLIKARCLMLADTAGIDATDKQVKDYLLSIGYSKVRATNFTGEYYARLTAGNLDAKEFAIIIKAASANVQRHVKHYDNLRTLCNSIRANVKAK